MEKTKLTKHEISWILYDVANSAFTMILTATIPIYFRSLADAANVAPEHATSIWGTTTSVALLILACLSPILGALADYQNMKKRIFGWFLGLGILGGLAMIFAPGWISFLSCIIIARIGYAACNIFYDAMLIDVTSDERMDYISSMGFACGYIGSCIPFVIGILLILLTPFGLDTVTATKLSFIITMVWWLVLSIPLLKNVKQTHYLKPKKHVISHSFRRLGVTFLKLRRDRKLLFYILGYFFYIDGVYTIISMATTYGGEVGIDSTQMVLALLLTQIVAFPFSILSASFAKRFGTIRVMKVYIILYMGICAFGYGLDTALEFWILALCVGICQGGIQALSRSQFGKMIPKKESSEYFGFFDIFGKFADFFGPLIISACAFFLHSSKYGVLSLIVLFATGFCFLCKSEKIMKAENLEEK
ncbi:MAG: MFS transporter [Lachnospiraceae bacterium]|nr:MFS transporter [Lachnospiraceae bacterium]